MINTRNLEWRRTAAPHTARRAATRRRRRAQASPLAPLGRLGVRAAGRVGLLSPRQLSAYFGVAGAVTVALAYLALSAQVTETSYDLARLQNQQTSLVAEQAQLRFKEAGLHTPAQVERDAVAAGLDRQEASKFLTYQPAPIDLVASIGEPAPDSAPAWQRAVASLVNGVAGSHDVLAAGN